MLQETTTTNDDDSFNRKLNGTRLLSCSTLAVSKLTMISTINVVGKWLLIGKIMTSTCKHQEANWCCFALSASFKSSVLPVAMQHQHAPSAMVSMTTLYMLCTTTGSRYSESPRLRVQRLSVINHSVTPTHICSAINALSAPWPIPSCTAGSVRQYKYLNLCRTLLQILRVPNTTYTRSVPRK